MYYGFYDANFPFYSKTAMRPSLEIGKLFAYYKKEGDVCRMLNDLETLDIYDRVFLLNDLGRADIKSSILLKENVEWRGLHYSGGRYVPFENMDIERIEPDFNIYFNLIKNGKKTGKFDQKIENQFNSRLHLRIFAAGEHVGYIKERGRKPIYIHDTHLNEIDDWYRWLEEYSKFTAFKLHLINPIYITEFNKTFEEFMESPFIAKGGLVYFPREFSDSEFRCFIKDYGSLLRRKEAAYIPLGFKEPDHYTLYNISSNSFRILSHVFYARSKKILLRIYVDDKDIPIKYRTFIIQLRNWINFFSHHYLSFEEFLKEKKAKNALRIMKEVCANNTKLRSMLAVPLQEIEKRGVWYYD